MSPRSAEFLEVARRRLSGAATVLHEDPGMALSGAYYAMLYAVRAALSERDLYAKTHRGTWSEFRRVFVATGEFDGALVAAAQRVQSQREDADYDAWLVPRDEAERVIELAETFVGAIERLLAD
jgi:uncharacterized protein (UPF0332 family)